ncbi:uncharacterized protein LOC141833213 [Curcuma longa]|uniref:uncharacterized protein LOC141833213 n=1 Tax=Curcuma longa TaxID=136217 RepID=UPI003D9E66A2
MGMGRLSIVVNAGIIGSVLSKNGQLPDVTRLFSGAFKIVTMLSQQDKNGTRSTSKTQSDFLLAEVNALREQLQLLAKSRSITVISGSGSGSGRFGVTTVIVIGALGYVFIWWKGWKLSDMMFVTQRCFTESRNCVGRQLDLLSSSIAVATRHFTSKINQVDKNLQECKELTVATKYEVVELDKDLNLFHTDLETFQRAVQDLDTKLERIEGTEEKTSRGVYYLCKVVKRLEEERNKRILEQERNRKLVGQNRKKELIQAISSTPLSIEPATSSESKLAPSASSYTALANRRVLRSTTIISVSGLKNSSQEEELDVSLDDGEDILAIEEADLELSSDSFAVEDDHMSVGDFTEPQGPPFLSDISEDSENRYESVGDCTEPQGSLIPIEQFTVGVEDFAR